MAARKAIIPASVRTLDIFSGKSQLDEVLEKERMLAAEDLEKTKPEREPITIETINNDLICYTSRNFSRLDGYRLCKRGDYHYLEHVRDNGTTYSGCYIPSSDLSLLADMFRKADDEQRSSR